MEDIMQKNPVLNSIVQRRSIRKYQQADVSDENINLILEAGRWAPSGLNNQPWRFQVLRDKKILDEVSQKTHYSQIVKDSPVCIAVFYHLPSGYNRDKDMMGLGAAIQNMLLAIHAIGLGAVWLGEILNKKEEVQQVLGSGEDIELAAIIAVGHPAEKPSKERKSLSELVIP